ncbi:MAG: hypothetical protein GY711_20105 [bacterium]|nr:hypothetical protein [bacterium]
MEEKVFPRPAVAAVLENYVEARLHTDKHKHLREFQKELTQSVAQPVYLAVDPVSGTQYARHDGATLTSDQPFIDFLEKGLAAVM